MPRAADKEKGVRDHTMVRYSRILIAKEIELGFLYIQSQAQHSFPKKNSQVAIYLGEINKTTSLSYNSSYHRLFGLTHWYRSVGARPKDVVTIHEVGRNTFRLRFARGSLQEEYSEEEVEEIVDLSELSSTAKGDIVEDRIKEQLLLFGQGLLSVYKPVTDSEGIDLIIVKNGVFQPVFLQVKGRFNLQKSGAFLCDIRMKTFKPHHSYFVIGAYFDPKTLELHDKVLFVPTKIAEKEGIKVKANGETRCRITTRLSDKTQSKWAPYIIDKKDIANKVLEKFEEMERYLK